MICVNILHPIHCCFFMLVIIQKPDGFCVYLSSVTVQVCLIILITISLLALNWRLYGLMIVCWITDHQHPCSNLSVVISVGCFIFHFASLPLEVAQLIWPARCTKVAVKHQSSSLSSCCEVLFIIMMLINYILNDLFDIHM